MPGFWKLAEVTPNAASNTLLTDSFEVPNDYTRFAVSVQTCTTWCITGTCNIRVEVSDDNSTFYEVGFSLNPGTATTGVAAESWGSGNNPNEKLIMCEALLFAPKYARLKFVNTATAAATFGIYAGN